MLSFVSHYQKHNQISSDYAFMQIFIIFLILLVFLLFSLEHKTKTENFTILSRDSSRALKGIAILFLIFGHLAYKCIEARQSFEMAGHWAVVIFLFLSGFGLSKTYGISGLTTNFILKRIRRLLFPVWITTTLFLVLDYFLLARVYQPQKIIFNFFGIISTGPPNGPAWFVTYIIYLYIIYFIVSLISSHINWQFFYLTFLSYIPFFVFYYIPHLEAYAMWGPYSIVFPFGVFTGINNAVHPTSSYLAR